MNVNIPLRYGLAAAMLSLLFSGVAQAACEWSDRIDKDEAECLSGEWTNRTWPDKDTASVKNECSELGTVVAKVDRKDAKDWTKWLEGDGEVNMSGADGNVRGIYCCSDLSDLCNKSDIVNPESCVEAFRTSEAHRETSDGEQYLYMKRHCHSASATVGPDGESCSFDMTCVWWETSTSGPNRIGVETPPWTVTASVQITVPYMDVPDLVLSREGELSVR